MGHGRKPKGRPASRNPGHVTRTIGRITAAHAPGAGFWRRSHDDKALFPRFCDALRQERTAHRLRAIERDSDTDRRSVYRCAYGHHYLISGPSHWHIGRPMC